MPPPVANRVKKRNALHGIDFENVLIYLIKLILKFLLLDVGTYFREYPSWTQSMALHKSDQLLDGYPKGAY